MQFTVGPLSSQEITIFVNTPASLRSDAQPVVQSSVDANGNEVTSGGNGYISTLRYDIFDQCGRELSGSFDINENFLGDWVNDSIGNNWKLPAALAATTQGLFADQVGSWCSAGACTPAPEPPQSPLTQVKVFHGSQCLLVGSSSIGKGVPVQADAQEHWQDHGTHENIVSPVPPGTAACQQ